jgi:transposase
MRRGMQGLALQVQESLSRNPHGGDLFIFRGRRGDLAKILWHDGIGLSLYAKRLDRGRFIWPSASDGVIAISQAQMAYMLEGIDWVRRITDGRQRVKVPYDEGIANHIGPESCTGGREAVREALTGVRVGQPLSDETLLNRSAHAIQSAEGNMVRCAFASAGQLRAVCRPWHARTSSDREPRGLRSARCCRMAGRMVKAVSRRP